MWAPSLACSRPRAIRRKSSAHIPWRSPFFAYLDEEHVVVFGPATCTRAAARFTDDLQGGLQRQQNGLALTRRRGHRGLDNRNDFFHPRGQVGNDAFDTLDLP